MRSPARLSSSQECDKRSICSDCKWRPAKLNLARCSVLDRQLCGMEREPFLLKISRIIGLCNQRFDPARNRLVRVRGVRFIYCIVLHLLYLLITPCIFVVLVQSFFKCQELDMLAVAYTVVCLSRILSMMTLLYNVWTRGGQLERLVNGMFRLMYRYRRHLDNYSLQRRNLVKLLLSSARVMMMLHLLIGPDSAVMCSETAGEITEVPPFYFVLALAALQMELVLCGTDYWIYWLLTLCDWLLECMARDVRALTADLARLPRGHGCHRAVYQQQLLAAWQHLWRCCMQLNALGYDFLQLFQWQILLNLLTSYVTDTTVAFNIVLYFVDGVYVSFWRSICYVTLCVSYHLDIMKLFSIFESNHMQWLDLLGSLQQMWCTLEVRNIDWTRDTHCVALCRQVTNPISVTIAISGFSLLLLFLFLA